MTPENLSERRKNILSIIVGSYTETAEPVSSATVARCFEVDVSSATIRNEMSALEEMGLITHPHTSAGRIPTDKGYRYYINHMLPSRQILPHQAYEVSKELKLKIENVEELIVRASRILATITEQAGIVTYPEMKDLAFSKLDLHRLDGRNVLVIWVTTSGFVQNYVIDMGLDISDGSLKKISNFFNQELSGLPFRDLPGAIMKRLSGERDSLYILYQHALQVSEEALRRIETAKGALEGSSYILLKPEFQDLAKTRTLFHALDQKEKLFDLMREDLSDGVHVLIGRENKWREIWDCSLITANYKRKGKTVGVLGILGPSRMQYPRIISLVDYLSKELTNAMERW